MIMAVVFDLIVLGLLLFAIWNGRRKGLVKMLWGLGSWLLVAILAVAFSGPFASLLEKTPIAQNMRAGVEDAIVQQSTEKAQQSMSKAEIAKTTGIPEALIPNQAIDGLNSGVSNMARGAAVGISWIMLRVIAGILLVLLLKLTMFILFKVLNLAVKLPIIHGVNSLAGCLVGLASMLIILYIAAGILAIFAGKNADLAEIIDSTIILKFIYNHNILLYLIKM